MTFNDEVAALANELRVSLQARTGTVDDAESVAILLWWSFILDHAKHTGRDPAALARAQVKAFISFAQRELSLQRLQ